MKLAILDLETTGSSPSTDRIIDIGLVLVDHGEITGTYEQLLNPERPVHPFILSMTQLSYAQLEEAPVAKTVLPHLMELLEDRMIIAHNAQFDYGFLSHELHRLGIKLTHPYACSVRVSRRLYPQHQRHSLDTLIERFNLTVEGRHRALPDAQAVYDFLEASSRKFSWDEVHRVIDSVSKSIRTPRLMATKPKPPQGPGVYIFYNQDHQPLYIGKSIHLPTRIADHFAKGLATKKQLQLHESVSEIETIACAGEIEALLLESRMIKQLQPLFNRRLRKTSLLWAAVMKTNESGYRYLEICKQTSIDSTAIDSIALISKSKSQLTQLLETLGRSHRLCPILLGVRSGPRCLAAQLGLCSGACAGQESPESFNQRLKEALAPYRLRPWPLDQYIVIGETTKDKESYHLAYNWVYLGSFPSQASLHNAVKHRESLSGEFELDTYRILVKALEHPKVELNYLPF